MDLVAHRRIIVALDVPTAEKAKKLVSSLRGEVGAFKIGLEAMSAQVAHEVARFLIAEGENVFWDGKWSDIPNTSEGAMKALRESLGADPWAVNVHANSGLKSIEAVLNNRGESLVFAVTVLTSLTDQMSQEIYGCNAIDAVFRLTQIAGKAGVQGIICSPKEANLLYGYLRSRKINISLVTPGVRPVGSEVGDQARPATPQEAIANGSDYLVIGRPITGAENPVSAAREIAVDIQQGLDSRVIDDQLEDELREDGYTS
jgi:orotidine-5'-phosphate decarboxylase